MARTTKGRLFRRGKKGIFYLEYYADSKRYVECLDVTTERAAETERKRIVAPFRTGQAVRTLEHRLADARQEHGELEAATRDKLELSDVWEKHPYTRTTPKRKKRTVRKLSETSIRDNEHQWNKFVRYMGEHHHEANNLEDVTAEHAAKYSKYLTETEKLSDNRHNKLIGCASVMFRLAGRPDPFVDVTLYEIENNHRVNLEPDEIKAVCEAATGEYRRLYAIAIFTGMRLKDCCLLRWGDNVKLDENRLIRRTSKTRKDVAFSVHRTLRAVLEETHNEDRKGYVCPEIAAAYEHDNSQLCKRIRARFEAAGLTTQEDVKGQKTKVSRRGFHSFRHTFITECARRDVPIGMIQDWIGHHSTSITRIYEHWQEKDSHDRILAALPVFESLNGNGKTPPVLPAADFKAELRGLLEGMTGKTWKDSRAKALQILDSI